MITTIEKDRARLNLLIDYLAFTFAFCAYLVLLQFVQRDRPTPRATHLAMLFASLSAVWITSVYVVKAHIPRRIAGVGRFSRLCWGAVMCAAILTFLDPVESGIIPRAQLLLLIVLALVTAVLFRAKVISLLLPLIHQNPACRVVVAGSNLRNPVLDPLFSGRPDYRPVLWNPADCRPANGREQVWKQFLQRNRPDELIILTDLEHDTCMSLVRLCRDLDIRWQLLPSLKSLGLDDLRLEVINDVLLAGSPSSAASQLNVRIKQLLDLVLGSVLLVLALPIMVVVAILIRLDSPGRAIISQQRVGRKGKLFRIYKFRTMYVNADEAVHRTYIQQYIRGNAHHEEGADGSKVFKVPNDRRVTRVGRVLRRYSIDELPQIFNVLRLEMSLVGPRPSLAYELECYEEWHKERLEALPGLTGMWQVSGRSLLSFNDMVRLDLEYVRSWTVAGDLRLLLKTIPVIFRGTGV